MHEAENTKSIQAAYAAFGRGDIPAVLANIDEHATWQPVVGLGKHVPTNGLHRGKAAIAEFFKTLGESARFTTFEPREFIAQGDKVVALGHYKATAIATGRGFETDWVMIFTFKDGKVVAFKEFADSAQINAAY